MELNKNIKAAEDFDILAALDECDAEIDAEEEKVAKETEEAQALKDEIFEKHTLVATAQAFRTGMMAYAYTTLANAKAKKPSTVKACQNKTPNGTKLTTMEGHVAAAGKVVKEFLKLEGVKKLRLYVPNSEVKRFSGILGRVNRGEKAVLTDEEIAHITDKKMARMYGPKYIAACKQLKDVLQMAKAVNKTVSFISLDETDGITLAYRMPASADGMKVTLKGGQAKVKVDNQFLTVKPEKFLNDGEYKLVLSRSGNIVIERDIKDADTQTKMAWKLHGNAVKKARNGLQHARNMDVFAEATEPEAAEEEASA